MATVALTALPSTVTLTGAPGAQPCPSTTATPAMDLVTVSSSMGGGGGGSGAASRTGGGGGGGGGGSARGAAWRGTSAGRETGTGGGTGLGVHFGLPVNWGPKVVDRLPVDPGLLLPPLVEAVGLLGATPPDASVPDEEDEEEDDEEADPDESDPDVPDSLAPAMPGKVVSTARILIVKMPVANWL